MLPTTAPALFSSSPSRSWQAKANVVWRTSAVTSPAHRLRRPEAILGRRVHEELRTRGGRQWRHHRNLRDSHQACVVTEGGLWSRQV